MSLQQPSEAESLVSHGQLSQESEYENSTKNTLCEICRRIDFHGYFSGHPPMLSLFWDLALVRSNSKSCVFCELLLSSIEDWSGRDSTCLGNDLKIWGQWIAFGKYHPMSPGTICDGV